MNGHEYTVEFRIWSDSIKPEEITRELGLEPCQVRLSSQSDRAMWAFNAGPEGDVPWTSLSEGLEFVLRRLWPKRQKIVGYKDRAQLIWWCGHFQSAFDGGPLLSPELMGRLGEFGAELYIDNYFSSEPETDK